jgi:glycosyltransferase A (GT-A) superfamily protein (DUF2064 family)
VTRPAASPAALVMARAPDDPAAVPGLAPLLGPDRAAALQTLLIRRAAGWAVAASPGAAFVAVTPPEAEGSGGASGVAGPGEPASSDGVSGGALSGSPALGTAAVATLVPAGVRVLAARDLEDAIAQVGRGPLLIAGTGCPRLGTAHAAAALDDLRAGCDVVFGATLDGGWYLAGLREPRPELLAVAALRKGGIGAVLARARELGAEVGMLRHERVLATPDDAAALVADPLVDAALRAALSA